MKGCIRILAALLCAVLLCASPQRLPAQVTVRNGVSLANTSGSPAYSSGSAYAKGDMVTSGGNTYVSLIGSNIGNAPATSPSDWQLMGGSAASGTPATVLITVAASNSINRAAAQYVATGTSDQATINAAIAACPATLPASAGPAQCTVVLQPGVYNVSGSIVIDTDNVNLVGEGHCMWGGLNSYPWNPSSKLTGSIGTGCAQIKATTTGFPLIAIQHSNQAGTGTDTYRHRGIKISQLYLVGSSYGNQGIVTQGNGTTCNTSYSYGGQTIIGCIDDNVEISDNVIQRTSLGIGVSLDAPSIHNNSIQDNNGPAEMICGFFARVHDELLSDNQGTQIIACSVGATYAHNVMANTQGDGIHFYTNSATAGANSSSGIAGSSYYIDGVRGVNVSGNVVTYTSDISGYNTNGTLPNSSDAVHITSGSSGNTVNGNTLNSGVNETGYAVNDLGTSDTVSDNTAVGTWRFGVGAPYCNPAAGCGATSVLSIAATSPITATNSNGAVTVACPTCSVSSGGLTAAPPYLTTGGNYYTADGFQVTKPTASPTWLNSVAPSSWSAATNGNIIASVTSTGTNYWQSQTLTTSVDAVFQGAGVIPEATGSNGAVAGIWIYDSTNHVIYFFSSSTTQVSSGGSNSLFFIQNFSYSGSGSPSYTSNIKLYMNGGAGFAAPAHMRILKSGTSLLFQVTQDGGADYVTLYTQTGVGTVSQGGISMYCDIAPLNVNIESLATN